MTKKNERTPRILDIPAQVKSLGKRLRQARLRKGLTQRQVGQKLGYKWTTGVTVVSSWEAGRIGPPIEKLPRLARIVGVKLTEDDLDALIGGDRLDSVLALLGSVRLERRQSPKRLVQFKLGHDRGAVQARFEELVDSVGRLDDETADDVLQAAIRMARGSSA